MDTNGTIDWFCFGPRIEDIVTVTETGGERFSTTDRALHIAE